MATVFRHSDFNERVHDKVLAAQSFGDCGLECSWHQVLRYNPLLEQWKADQAVSRHPHRSGQFRRFVHGHIEQVIGADGLDGEICPRCLWRARPGLRGRSNLREPDGQQTNGVDEHRE